MAQKQRPTDDQIRVAIEARIDRLMALEELAWEVPSFIEDVWGPVPEAWSARLVELGVALARSPPLASGEPHGASWEAGRSRILAGFSPDERWVIGLNDHLWGHAFDGGREAIRRAAVESFLVATLTYIREHPDVAPLSPPVGRRTAHRQGRTRAPRSG